MGFEGALLLDGLTNTSFMFESHLFVACVCVCMCVRVCENIGGGILEEFIHGIVFRMRKKFDYCLR